MSGRHFILNGRQNNIITRALRTQMLDPQKTLEREALLKRHRELQAEIAQHERNMREGEARLPIEEQLRLNLRRRYIKVNIPELTGEFRVEIPARCFS
jgi:hypothetical protein